MQRVFRPCIEAARFQTANSGDSTINHARQFVAEFLRAIGEQTLFCFLRRKPCRFAIRFLGPFQAGHLAKVSGDGTMRMVHVGFDARCALRSLAVIARERHLFDPTVDARLFECFKRRRLRMAQVRFDSSLGKGPAPAASSYQQELETTLAVAVTNRCNLLAFLERPSR